MVSGISIHTLRYYEKEKLIIPKRKINGRRLYTDEDMVWVEIVKRLKDTGMSIKRFGNIRNSGQKGTAPWKNGWGC